MKTNNVLIIDNHPVTCLTYRQLLWDATKTGKLPRLNIDCAHDVKNALYKIERSKKAKPFFEIVFLDSQIPDLKNGKTYSSDDLARLIRSINPKVRLIVQTGLTDNYSLYKVFKTHNPEGILVKSDLDEDNFISGVQTVMEGMPYYSSTFNRLLRNQFSKDYVLGEYDRELLYLLSIGLVTREISKRIPWSSSTIEKRKRALREQFGVKDASLQALITAARKAGFL